MANKSSKGKRLLTSEEKRLSRQRRILQIAMIIFSIILILSMVLSLAARF
jgi:predicted nucleic acid-binding Zn ribbon protein